MTDMYTWRTMVLLPPGILVGPVALVTNMASEAMSKHLMLKLSWGSMLPHPPSASVLTQTPSSVPPQSQVPSTILIVYGHSELRGMKKI